MVLLESVALSLSNKKWIKQYTIQQFTFYYKQNLISFQLCLLLNIIDRAHICIYKSNILHIKWITLINLPCVLVRRGSDGGELQLPRYAVLGVVKPPGFWVWESRSFRESLMMYCMSQSRFKHNRSQSRLPYRRSPSRGRGRWSMRGRRTERISNWSWRTIEDRGGYKLHPGDR